METQNLRPVLQAIGLGLIAGMRSASAPAIASHLLNRYPSEDIAGSKLGFIQSDGLAMTLKVMAAGEFIADKLPFAPARTAIPSVVTRGISGALSGAAVSKLNKKSLLMSAILGATAAVAATYAFYYLRKGISEKFDIYDPLIGIAEDALVIGGGLALTRTVQNG